MCSERGGGRVIAGESQTGGIISAERISLGSQSVLYQKWVSRPAFNDSGASHKPVQQALFVFGVNAMNLCARLAFHPISPCIREVDEHGFELSFGGHLEHRLNKQIAFRDSLNPDCEP